MAGQRPSTVNPWLLRQEQPAADGTPGRADEGRHGVPGAGVATGPSDRHRPATAPDPGLPTPTGPAAPQQGRGRPAATTTLPTRHHDGPSPTLWVCGVHGGAGESRIAALAPDWVAADHAVPGTPGPPAAVLMTCRSHVPGLLAAQAALTTWAAGALPQIDLLGLLIIADAPGRIPRPISDLARVVAGGAPRRWDLPWIDSWRLGESPPIGELPRPVRRLTSDLFALTDTNAHRGDRPHIVAPSGGGADLSILEGQPHAHPRPDRLVQLAPQRVHPVADPG